MKSHISLMVYNLALMVARSALAISLSVRRRILPDGLFKQRESATTADNLHKGHSQSRQFCHKRRPADQLLVVRNLGLKPGIDFLGQRLFRRLRLQGLDSGSGNDVRSEPDLSASDRTGNGEATYLGSSVARLSSQTPTIPISAILG